MNKRPSRCRRGVVASILLALFVPTIGMVSTAPSSAEAHFFDICDRKKVVCKNGKRVRNYPGDVDRRARDQFENARALCGILVPRMLSGCIKRYGDYVYVRDERSDGYSVILTVDSPFDNGRVRLCRNRLGKGRNKIARCNFNWREGKRWAVFASKFDKGTGDHESLGWVLGFDD